MGQIRKPTLREIDNDVGFSDFNTYTSLLKLTPKKYYEDILGESENPSLKESQISQEKETTMWNIILADENIRSVYLKILNFYFLEYVVFDDGIKCFVTLKKEYVEGEMSEDDIVGIINENIFTDVLSVIQQLCYISQEDEEEEQELKFKNKKAKKRYEKIQNAKKENLKKENLKNALNYSVENIISVVSNNHPSLNPITIYDLTIFQLYDSFNRIRDNKFQNMRTRSISIWGDQDNKFDYNEWFKNIYDNQ